MIIGSTPQAHEPAPDPTGDLQDALLGGPDDAESAEHETRQWTVEPLEHGMRLDRLLATRVPEFSRTHLQDIVAHGGVWLGGVAATTPSRKVRAGQVVAVELRPTEQAQAFSPQAMSLDIVAEDEHLMVLNKPAGLVVHPAAGNWSGTLLNGLLAHHRGAAALPRAGIVHRLDKDTSGLMVVAKTLTCHHALVQAIAARLVHRQYRALAHGRISADEQMIDAPVGRHPSVRVRMAVVAGGKPSQTTVRVVGRGLAGATAVECTLHTGRTHQIRVHLAHLGHPLLGDVTYGGTALHGLQRQALHAYRLSFTHPISGGLVDFTAPLPPDLAPNWAAACSAAKGSTL